ncbi:MarR family winged helix-turn-helix transcriptional regulator [Gluconobacter thailandicus]|uniref:MarR family transcriptional regulator n=1 Tax=Gluconobacter thailandicus TaxID=257438 RepID=A0AAP9EUC0_GLUTH|nr:MarR family transcriptional regulator [Gluconobacter thailandicus]KXV35951.1 MarR family transcriptional regulator [Gluconobacter thailandicus]QEH96952.1 MarR family transcriptional regulator [Gluconobacter thailandicus]
MEKTTHADLQEALRSFYVNSQRLLETYCAEQGISFTRIRLMIFIETRGWTRSVDVIEALSLAPRTVTEAIDALEKDGLACRSPDPEDRRAKRVSLTPKGEKILSEFEPIRNSFAADLFSVLSTEAERTLTSLVKKLNDRIGEIEHKYISR